MAGAKARNCSIDIFRYFCAILIVIIHTNPMADYGANISFGVSQILPRIGVPFFFAVAGYFYTQKLEKGQKIFLSYIKKLFTTYFIWSCVYLLVEFISWGHGQIKGFVVTSALNFLIKGSYYHFWFFPALIISVSIVTLIYKLRLQKLLFPLAIVLYAVGCIGCSYYSLGMKIPVLNSLYAFSDFLVIRRIFLMGLPFFICGQFVNKIRSKALKLGNAKLFVFLAVAIAVWFSEIILVVKMGLQQNIIITFGLFPLVIAVMLFLLKNPMPKFRKLSEKCRILANFTYYSHPLIMLVIKTFIASVPNLVMFVSTVIVAAIIGLVLSKFSNNKIVKLIAG